MADSDIGPQDTNVRTTCRRCNPRNKVQERPDKKDNVVASSFIDTIESYTLRFTVSTTNGPRSTVHSVMPRVGCDESFLAKTMSSKIGRVGVYGWMRGGIAFDANAYTFVLFTLFEFRRSRHSQPNTSHRAFPSMTFLLRVVLDQGLL